MGYNFAIVNTFEEISGRRQRRATLEVRLRQAVILLIILIGVFSSYFIVRFFQERDRPPRTYYEYQLKAWTEALAKYPNSPDVLTNLGYIYLKMGRDNRGLGYLNSALKINSKFAPAYYNLGIYYRKKGDFKTAIPYLKKAAKYSNVGLRYLAYYTLGEVYEGLGKTDAALEAYKKSLEDNNTMWNTLYKVGKIYEKKGEFKLALENYQRAALFNQDDEKLQTAIKRVEAKLSSNK